MRLDLKNELGVYKPLDLFEDFEIKYNHQYLDYKSVSGNKIPYTNKFKIPLTDRNRSLCTVIFDATYPKKYSIDGRAVYNSGEVAFYFVADIEGQTINVLEPYIEISIIDRISKAIKNMNKYKMSDLMSTESFNLDDDFVYSTPDLLAPEKSFLFPHYNFNNKGITFGFDPMRKINQLQPTFIINRLMQDIFTYTGLGTFNSRVLKTDNAYHEGLKANTLGLTLPCELKTLSDTPYTAEQYFAGENGVAFHTPRVVGVPSMMRSSSRITLGNILNNIAVDEHSKMNFDWQSEFPYLPDNLEHIYGGRMCSTVDGKMVVNISPNTVANKPTVGFGLISENEQDGVDFIRVTNIVSTSNVDLDVYIVNADMTRSEVEQGGGGFLYGDVSSSYDSREAQLVGVARFAGVVNEKVTYEIEFTNSDIEFEVEANQDIELALIVQPPFQNETTTVRFDGIDSSNRAYTWDLIVRRGGFVEYKMITSAFHPDDFWQSQREMWNFDTGGSKYPSSWHVSFPEATNVPCGMKRMLNNLPSDDLLLNPTVIDMSETMKSIKDYTLLEVVKMIMERFNLYMFTDSDGEIHIDSYGNMLSGEKMIIDHLIDEEINVSYSDNDKGIINIKDTNPSFYKEGFNQLEKFEVSEDKREEYSLNFKSAIISKKMFKDEYDDKAFELLAWVNDSNYWGTSSRVQVEAKDLKPSFLVFEDASIPVYFPYNDCTYTEPLPNSNDTLEEYNVGFYNHFMHLEINGSPVYHKSQVSNRYFNSTYGNFDFVSFEDNDFIVGNNNLYKRTWYSRVQDILDDESVKISIEIYASEIDVQKLLDFPLILWKGQEWHMQGFNGYPLSAQDGGLVKIELIKKVDWTNDGFGVTPII